MTTFLQVGHRGANAPPQSYHDTKQFSSSILSLGDVGFKLEVKQSECSSAKTTSSIKSTLSVYVYIGMFSTGVTLDIVSLDFEDIVH